MNMKKEMSIAVVFLVAAIIFVSSTPMANNAFAQTEGEVDLVQTEGKDYSGSKNYENFLNCLSDASGENSFPAGDQIVNCLVESGYIQGSSSTSNAVDTEDETENEEQLSVVGDESDEAGTENVQVSVVGDESDEDEDEDEDENEDEDEGEDEDEE
jgi:hypothetical protein